MKQLPMWQQVLCWPLFWLVFFFTVLFGKFALWCTYVLVHMNSRLNWIEIEGPE